MRPASLIQYLEMLNFSGLNYLFCKELDLDVKKKAKLQPELKQKLINENKLKYSNCTLCGLHKNRINFVYGEGNATTRLLIIGEGPGQEENRQGKPFVGRSGQLLTKMLKAINIEREDIYITNIVKCQPPDNRNPLESEVESCLPYLTEQISIIEPEIIVLLGKVAAVSLFKQNKPISQFRNEQLTYENIKTFVTYHPSALLRNPEFKKMAWIDLQEIQKNYESCLNA